jgi:alpha,alpha-trehalase
MTTTSEFPPISDYAFLSDCHSVALVSRDGSVEWACFGRLDRDPVFARMLDRRRGGWFRVGPKEPAEVSRRYLPETNVLETTFRTTSGAFTVTDCLPVAPLPGSAGKTAFPPGSRRLVRLIRVLDGEPEVEVDFRPRFSFGLTTPMVTVQQDDFATAIGGPEAAVLETDLGVLGTDGASCQCSTRLRPGDLRYVVMTSSDALELNRLRLTRQLAVDLVDETVAFWRSWVARGSYPESFRDAVVRSALVLKGLTDAGTGAIAAAATTSLPEEIGGERNWDYRFCWLRDSASVVGGLGRLGHLEEVTAFGNWLRRATAGRADELQIMYGLGGERLLHEATVGHLGGYRDSRPVRTGNGAWDQFQLDTYGELVGTADLVADYGGPHVIDPAWVGFLATVVEAAIKRWNEPDEGIWEVRGGRQHFTFSKLMAWIAVDRGIHLVERAGRRDEFDLGRWRTVRDEIRTRLEGEGVDPDTGAFTQALGSRDLDASALQIGIQGFVPPDDPRFDATIRAIDEGLSVGGHIYRYRSVDGLAGDEGTFVFCTLWQASALAMVGRVGDARKRLELVLGRANDLGLLAEEIDPQTGMLLGNFPQAFSHVGVIGTACAIEAHQRGASPISDIGGGTR